jgi:P27 family predicted phage terminase small subunit
MWDLIVAEMEADALKKAVYGPALEVVCETFARWRQAEALRRKDGLMIETSQGMIAAPWIGIGERASAQFKTWCVEYGLTPNTRAALTKEDEPADAVNPLASLTAQRQKHPTAAA